jgi:hypothetical protein
VGVELSTAHLEYGANSDIIDEVVEMKDNLKNLARTAKRKYGADIWLRGGVHLELIRDVDVLWHMLGHTGSSRQTDKYAVYKELMLKSKEYKERTYYVVIHFHALADKSVMTDSEFKNLFSYYWGLTKRQIHITSLWKRLHYPRGRKNISLDESLRKFAGYCFNGSNPRLRFKGSWGAGRRLIETKQGIDSKGQFVAFGDSTEDAEYGDILSIEEIQTLIGMHHQVSGDSNKGLVVSIY